MRSALRAGGGLLFTGVVLAYGGFAWREAEAHALSAAAAEGRALLAAVASGVETSLAASRAVETLLAEPLTDAAHAVAARLADAPGFEEDALRGVVAERRLAGAMLLEASLGVVASVEPEESGDGPRAADPFSARRLARFDDDALVARLRSAGLGARRAAVAGFEDGPFAARTEFAAAVEAPSVPGFVVLRADASRVERFRREAGVARVLRDASRAPGIASLTVQAEDGTCLAAGDPSLVGAVLPAAPSRPAWRTGADGRRTLDLAIPVAWEEGPRGDLRVALDAAVVDDVVRRTRRDVAVTTGAAVAAGLGGLLALAAVERRRRAAETRLRDELAQRERFAAMGRLAAGVAHEIRGPLNALSLHTQLLAREAPRAGPERVVHLTGEVRAAVARIDRAVAEFLALGRAGAPSQRAATDLAAVVADALATEGGSVQTAAPADPLVVRADRGLLAKAVANLLRNARQHAPPETVAIAWRREGAEAVLDVDDGGPGVAPELRDAVFEPFRTTRPAGTGLGLALAKEAVEGHGGRIEVLDAPAGGARFRVRLPLEATT